MGAYMIGIMAGALFVLVALEIDIWLELKIWRDRKR